MMQHLESEKQRKASQVQSLVLFGLLKLFQGQAQFMKIFAECICDFSYSCGFSLYVQLDHNLLASNLYTIFLL